MLSKSSRLSTWACKPHSGIKCKVTDLVPGWQLENWTPRNNNTGSYFAVSLANNKITWGSWALESRKTQRNCVHHQRDPCLLRKQWTELERDNSCKYICLWHSWTSALIFTAAIEEKLKLLILQERKSESYKENVCTCGPAILQHRETFHSSKAQEKLLRFSGSAWHHWLHTQMLQNELHLCVNSNVSSRLLHVAL